MSSNSSPVDDKTELENSGDEETSLNSITETFLVNFPGYTDLMQLYPRGLRSDSFTTADGKSTWCVKLYPKGGGHRSKRAVGKFLSGGDDDKPEEETGGFGMSYKVLPMFGPKNEQVGVYLQYLDGEKDTVDATFDLRCKGMQVSSRKFDVEWSAGMRFIPPTEQTNLKEGVANDFGAHLMQSHLLKQFMGADVSDNANMNGLQVQVRLTRHLASKPETTTLGSTASEEREEDRGSSFFSFAADIRKDTDPELTRVGKIVVPVLNKLSQRPRMFEVGAYPGVEYRILRIFDSDGKEAFYSPPTGDCEYELKPIYPLVNELERPWPVRVKSTEIPKLLTGAQYNILSAVGSVFTAIAGLVTAFTISQAVSFFVIPSQSMDPTFQVGDVLLVEKVSPRLPNTQYKPDDIVLFHPPSPLLDIVQSTGGRISSRDLFVKRIAATQGDEVVVQESGSVTVNAYASMMDRHMCTVQDTAQELMKRYLKPQTTTIPPDEVFVLGDCADVSIDSRVWGSLPKQDIVGRPLMRIWPLDDRWGSIPDVVESWEDN